MITKQIHLAIQELEAGKLVAIPTETVYGLAANAFNETAINSIFKLKKRPKNNPLIVHVKSIDSLESIVNTIPNKAKQLAEQFWPGPLTLILPKNPNLSQTITAGKDTVAVRIPNHPLTLELLNKIDFPLVAPSANPYQGISSTNANHVQRYFSEEELGIILDGGACEEGLESTIVGFYDDQVIIYRLGTIPIEAIEKCVGKVSIQNENNSNPEAPGMHTKHYAPCKPSYLTSDIQTTLLNHPDKKIGIITFQDKYQAPNITKQIQLSPTGDLKEASQRLYQAMHEMDVSVVDLILFEPVPNYDLGISINDKLNRATKK